MSENKVSDIDIKTVNDYMKFLQEIAGLKELVVLKNKLIDDLSGELKYVKAKREGENPQEDKEDLHLTELYEELKIGFSELQLLCRPDEFVLRQRELLEAVAKTLLYMLETEEEASD